MKILTSIIPIHQRPAWTPFMLDLVPSTDIVTAVTEFSEVMTSCITTSKECIHLYEDKLNYAKSRLRDFARVDLARIDGNYGQKLGMNISQVARQVGTPVEIVSHSGQNLYEPVMVGNEALELVGDKCNISGDDLIVLENIRFCIENRKLCEAGLNERMYNNMTIESMEDVELSSYAWMHDEINSPLQGATTSPSQTQPVAAATILCMTYSMSSNHDRIADIIATWGSHCDGYLAFSNSSDPSLSILRVSLPAYITNPRIEEYNEMWVKAQSIWQFVEASGLIAEFDYFILGGDDMYIIPDNLRWFLQSSVMSVFKDIAREHYGVQHDPPLYLGRPIRVNSFREFVSGGSGYVLNAVSVRILNSALRVDGDLRCLRELSASMEDLLVGSCLLHAGVEAFPFPLHYHTVSMPQQPSHINQSKESTGNMSSSTNSNSVNLLQVWLAQLFHPLSPSAAFQGSEEWYTRMTVHSERGRRCCSPLAISFQNIKPPHLNMRCIHSFLYQN